MVKKCKICQIEKSTEEFSILKPYQNYNSYCKPCHREVMRKHYRKNKKIYNERNEINRKMNRDRYNATARKNRELKKEHYNLQKKLWRQKNLARIRERDRLYSKNKRKNDINFRLRIYLRTRINRIIKINKGGSPVKDLGCNVNELVLYLASKFKDGMTWENYGDWEIDHITPLSHFDLTDRVQFLKACHYTNLQPLWKSENRSKGNRLYE